MNTAVRKHEVETPKATGSQVPLLAAAAELVAALEAFEVGKDKSRGPEPAVVGRETSGRVASPAGTPSLRLVNPAAPSAGPQTSATEAATAKSSDVTLLPAWRDYVAKFEAPNTRYLVITARDQASLYDFFSRTFAGVETVEVRMDQRGDRRPQADSVAVDGRQAERRSRPEIDNELRASGFAFVRSLTRPDVGRVSASREGQEHPPAVDRAPAAVEPLRRSPFRRASSPGKGAMLGDSPLGGDVRIHASQDGRPQRGTVNSY